MKVQEERTLCDLCDIDTESAPAFTKCLRCERDLCVSDNYDLIGSAGYGATRDPIATFCRPCVKTLIKYAMTQKQEDAS
mgnify:CR=1 FL=1